MNPQTQDLGSGTEVNYDVVRMEFLHNPYNPLFFCARLPIIMAYFLFSTPFVPTPKAMSLHIGTALTIDKEDRSVQSL